MKAPAHIDWIEEVDSTNSEMSRRVESLPNLSVIAASRQTAGRGQRGNTWLSGGGLNLTFSLLLKFRSGSSAEDAAGTGPYASCLAAGESMPPLEARDQFQVSQAVALGVCDYLLSHSIHATIKWPNDIYVADRKICGILMENSISGTRIATSVVGIGLNVNQANFPASLPNPTSMRCCLGRELCLEEELPKLRAALVARVERLGGKDVGLMDEYAGRLYRKGEVREYVDLTSGSRFKGRITGVEESGLLKMETESGLIKKFAFKEISFVI